MKFSSIQTNTFKTYSQKINVSYLNYRLASEDLLSESETYLRRHRAVRMLDSAPFLVTDQATKWGSSHTEVNRRSIARSLAPKLDEPGEKDADCMARFISNSCSDSAIIPVIVNRKQILPDGIPVLDVLRAHLSKWDTWKYPSASTMQTWANNRGYSDTLLETTERKEILIGVTSEAETKEIAQWAIDCYERSEDLNPIGALPFSVEYIPITSHDILRLGRKEYQGKSIRLQNSTMPPKIEEDGWFVNEDGKTSDNNWTTLPAKICLGDGISWMLVVSFPMFRSKDRFSIDSGPIQSGLVQFLHHLPPLIGYNIKTDVVAVESTLSTMYGFRLKLPHFIYLPAMAVMAGWKMSTISSEAISMVCLGTPVNHLISARDGLWGLPIKQLPPPLTIYLIGELKNIFLSYNVLSICLREEILADPDIWCYLTGQLQRYTLAWWADWLTNALRGVFVDKNVVKNAGSRAQLLSSIRAIDPAGNELDHPPYRIQVVASMLEKTATIMRGGPRFLHIEREGALTKIQIFDRMQIDTFQTIASVDITEAVLLYARFGQRILRPLDHKLPVGRGNDHRVLTFHPSLPLTQVQLATGSLTIQYILDKFRIFARPQQEGLLEWARLNPQSVEAFFEACIRNTLFSKKCKSTYEPMRMIVVRVMNRHPIEIPACEEAIGNHQKDAVRQAGALIQYLEGEINALTFEKENAEREKEALEERVRQGKIRERVEGRGPAQPVPRHRTAANLVLQRVGDHPVNDIEAARRGSSPERRAREQPGVAPPVMPSEGLGVRGPWRDDDEDPEDGRAWSFQPAAAQTVTEFRTVRRVS